MSGMTQASSAQSNAAVVEAIDDCGLRFLLASRHHVYLLNTLPLRQRAQMQQLGLSPAYYVWAFHSESQDELLNSLPSMQKGAPTWAEMRQFGVGWWLRNINSLQRCAEKVSYTDRYTSWLAHPVGNWSVLRSFLASGFPRLLDIFLETSWTWKVPGKISLKVLYFSSG